MEYNNLSDIEIMDRIDIAFSRLIGPLVIMAKHNSFNKSKSEIIKLIDTVASWGAKYQKERNLNFISREELLDIYYRIEDLKDKFLFDSKLGSEAILSDEITIWMFELMNLRKVQIERILEKNKI